jgi:hypothetical protein
MLLVVAEPWGRLFAACHGGSATDCTAPPCWSQIVYTSRSSCDLRRCPPADGGNPPDIRGVPTQTTAATVLRRPRHPGEPARPRTREGGDPRHLPWERPGLLTEALARSERAAGRRTLPRPAARFMSGVSGGCAKLAAMPGRPSHQRFCDLASDEITRLATAIDGADPTTGRSSASPPPSPGPTTTPRTRETSRPPPPSRSAPRPPTSTSSSGAAAGPPTPVSPSPATPPS